MGFFSKLFGGKEEAAALPALDPASAGAQRITKFSAQFTALAQKIDDRFELVPSEKVLYVFLGKPPGMFGIAWFAEGDSTEHNLKTLMSKKGLSQRKIDNIMSKLRAAYTDMDKEPRYGFEIAGKKTIVVTNDAFAQTLYNILHIMDE